MMKNKGNILITGGCGYIGSHTLVEFIEAGYGVVSLDSLVRSSLGPLKGVYDITGVNVEQLTLDLCNKGEAIEAIQKAGPFDGIIHFAALKYVDESVEKPLLYYRNNLLSLTHVLEIAAQENIPHVVFSSSCSVYGNVASLPVTEQTPVAKAESPYAATKQMGETIVCDTAEALSNIKAISLRYFNPVGAHMSAKIGESPTGKPNNLVPRITGTASGKYDALQVFGSDYPTRDGTCIRDYIHVSDIARAHVLAFEHLADRMAKNYDVFNLGTGRGVSVLEAIASFERVSGKKLDYNMAARRAGDVIAIYANNEKAEQVLGWKPTLTLDDMMLSAWRWEQKQKD